jgi:hypothetical protein
MIDENALLGVALLGFARRARHRSESTVFRPQRGQITLDEKSIIQYMVTPAWSNHTTCESYTLINDTKGVTCSFKIQMKAIV